jgi:NADH pyrophosphatase NudC (nudix superfamily)
MHKTHPLEVLKFCPKCGSPKFEIVGERSMKCSDCGFHYYINASAAVAALVSDGNGKLMLVTRGIEPDYGKLDLPGGFVDHNETIEQALKRELFEELGMKTKSIKYLTSAPNEYIFSGFSVFTVDMAFEVIPESIENLKPMDDILEYQFYAEKEFNYDDIPAPSIKQFVIDFFKK